MYRIKYLIGNILKYLGLLELSRQTPCIALPAVFQHIIAWNTYWLPNTIQNHLLICYNVDVPDVFTIKYVK